AEAVAGAPGGAKALLLALGLDARAVGGQEHLVPALELPQVEAAARGRAVVVADDADPAAHAAIAHGRVELGGDAAEVAQGGLAAAAARGEQAGEEEPARRVAQEGHLAVLRDRVVGRQLAGRKDILGEGVARGGAEVLV